MTKNPYITAALLVLLFVSLTVIATAGETDFVRGDYQDVRIKEFPVAVQCWTFHKFTFFETLEKVRDLGVHYLQPYRGQKLGSGGDDVVFGPDTVSYTHLTLPTN